MEVDSYPAEVARLRWAFRDCVLVLMVVIARC